MKRLFWKAFYKIKLGENYGSILNLAQLTCNSIKGTTKGDLSSFYNVHGEQIRGWHRPSFSFSKNEY